MNPWPETCPDVTIITVGMFKGSDGKVSVEEIMRFAEKQFYQNESGKAFYRGVFVAWRKAKVIKMDDGSIDFEYRMFISDEVKNIKQFEGWGM